MKTTFRTLTIAATIAAAGLGTAAVAQEATDYPTQPIRFIAPFSPGGTTDLLTRLLADHMSQSMGQPVLVENKPGSAGLLGAEMTAKADPDGYTLVNVISTHSIQDQLHANLSFDPVADFEPVIMLATTPLTLVVHPSVPVETGQEFVEYAKENPLSYGMSGIGAAVHVAMEHFKQMTDIDVQAIPYQGGGPAKQDVVGGHIPVVMSGLNSVQEEIKAGQLRALFIASPERSPNFPDLPTAEEAGFPGYEREEWWAVLAPKGTPKPVIDKLNAEITRIMELPEVQERLAAFNIDYLGSTPEEAAAFMAEAAVSGTEILRAAGMAPE